MLEKDIIKYAGMDKGWFDYADFYGFIASRPGFYRFAEIGVWKGHSISFLASKLADKIGVEIYAVDLFDDRTNNIDYAHIEDSKHQLTCIYDMYNYNLKITNTRHLIKDIQGCSWEVAKLFEDGYFDFVFIDADHHYTSVIKDIDAWIVKVKKGGILAGHDYQGGEVKKAVHEKFSNPIIHPPNVWYVTL